MAADARPMDDVFADVLGDHPELIGTLGDAHAAAWAAVDPRLLELCRLRVAALLGNHADLATRTPSAGASVSEATIAALPRWPTSDEFSDAEKTCLALTEQFVMDVASMTDEQVHAVSAHLGETGTADFIGALLVIEQRQRMRLAWQQVLEVR